MQGWSKELEAALPRFELDERGEGLLLTKRPRCVAVSEWVSEWVTRGGAGFEDTVFSCRPNRVCKRKKERKKGRKEKEKRKVWGEGWRPSDSWDTVRASVTGLCCHIKKSDEGTVTHRKDGEGWRRRRRTFEKKRKKKQRRKRGEKEEAATRKAGVVCKAKKAAAASPRNCEWNAVRRRRKKRKRQNGNRQIGVQV